MTAFKVEINSSLFLAILAVCVCVCVCVCVLTLCVSSRLMSFGRHLSVVACQKFSGFLWVLKSQNNLGFSFLFFLVSFGTNWEI